jgi:hypothetical protein
MSDDDEGHECAPMALRFVCYQEQDGKYTATPIEVAANTQAMMGLLLSLQEIQQMFGLPIPEGIRGLVRGDGDWPPKLDSD